MVFEQSNTIENKIKMVILNQNLGELEAGTHRGQWDYFGSTSIVRPKSE